MKFDSVLFVSLVFSVASTTLSQQNFDPDMIGEVGCAGGVKGALASYEDVHACKGQWSGHVENANVLCGDSWHVCSWNDSAVLKIISWHDAATTSGCYAINAAHNSGTCSECDEHTPEDDMAAIGADCPNQDPTAKSCFGRGKIEASFGSVGHRFRACHTAPWLTGVLCCKNIIDGEKPSILKSPTSSVVAKAGTPIKLGCKAEGIPRPSLYWFKDGIEINAHFLNDDYFIDGESLTIVQAKTTDSGLYQCKAKNKFGVAVSYKSQVRIYDPNPSVSACRDLSQQQVFHGAQLAACGGRWKGHIKKATKQLCAAGWHVCSIKDRDILQFVPWSTAMQIGGCFAYNAASSAFFECTKCSPRKKGNRMAGFGSTCGYSNYGMSSCLSHGRMDMFASPDSTLQSRVNSSITENRVLSNDRAARTCNYVSDSINGVLCCKDNIKKKRRKSRGKCRAKCQNGGKCVGKNLCKCPRGVGGENCEIAEVKATCKVPCDANAYCSTKGVCKCNKGYKMNGRNVCIFRKVRRKTKMSSKKKLKKKLIRPDLITPPAQNCGETMCKNGGFCQTGLCVCATPFYGKSCELSQYHPLADATKDRIKMLSSSKDKSHSATYMHTLIILLLFT